MLLKPGWRPSQSIRLYGYTKRLAVFQILYQTYTWCKFLHCCIYLNCQLRMMYRLGPQIYFCIEPGNVLKSARYHLTVGQLLVFGPSSYLPHYVIGFSERQPIWLPSLQLNTNSILLCPEQKSMNWTTIYSELIVKYLWGIALQWAEHVNRAFAHGITSLPVFRVTSVLVLG